MSRHDAKIEREVFRRSAGYCLRAGACDDGLATACAQQRAHGSAAHGSAAHQQVITIALIRNARQKPRNKIRSEHSVSSLQRNKRQQKKRKLNNHRSKTRMEAERIKEATGFSPTTTTTSLLVNKLKKESEILSLVYFLPLSSVGNHDVEIHLPGWILRNVWLTEDATPSTARSEGPGSQALRNETVQSAHPAGYVTNPPASSSNSGRP
ncbi:uncharacterized protein LOC131474325 [Solea solea]|uniref:uncharacterized protein LOC131474325 n=1 Tax=Solea solea TaxID=90069 RepID=UPI00272D802B|nr:uncharacterized protein LOC131474325 [Solea solea]